MPPLTRLLRVAVVTVILTLAVMGTLVLVLARHPAAGLAIAAELVAVVVGVAVKCAGPKSRTVGVEITPEHVRIVEVSRDASGFSVRKFAETPTPEGSLNSCEIVKPREVASALRSLIVSQRASRRLVLGIDATATVFKRMKLPPMADEELPSAIKWEMVDYFPGSEVAVSYRVLKQDGSGIVVQAVGAKASCVGSLSVAGRSAGGRLVAIDVDSVAAYRALVWSGSISGEACLLVHPRKGWVSITAFDKEGMPVFARHLRGEDWDGARSVGVLDEVVRSLDYYSSLGRELGSINQVTVLLTQPQSQQLLTELQGMLPWLPVKAGYIESGQVPPEFVVALGLAIWEKDR
ncbi:MAG: type IV pilus biogenesis protein PilM [Bacillota bacterium]